MDKRQPQGIRGTSGVLTAVLLVIGWSLHGVGWEGEAFAAGADIVAAAQSRLPPGAAQASSPRSGERSGAAAAGVATGADAAGFVVRAGAASARPLRTFAAPLPAEAEAAAGGEPVVCNAPARSVRLPAASRRVGAAARPELTAGSTKERPDSVSSGGAAAAAISVSASRSLTGVAPVVEPHV